MTNNTKLWVDDERPAPDETWDVAKSAEQAREMIDETVYDTVSLDYVLVGWDSGFDVLLHIEKTGRWPQTLNSHSGSSTGRYQIWSYAKENGPDTMEVTDDATLGR